MATLKERKLPLAGLYCPPSLLFSLNSTACGNIVAATISERRSWLRQTLQALYGRCAHSVSPFRGWGGEKEKSTSSWLWKTECAFDQYPLFADPFLAASSPSYWVHCCTIWVVLDVVWWRRVRRLAHIHPQLSVPHKCFALHTFPLFSAITLHVNSSLPQSHRSFELRMKLKQSPRTITSNKSSSVRSSIPPVLS